MTIQLNAGITKPSKRDALYLATKLVQEGELPPDERESLFKYFAPAVPKTPKEPWQWIAQAIAKKEDPRLGLNYLYSDGKRLVATNGHILKFKPTGWAQGYYCPKTGNPVTGIDYQYPNFDRVIPTFKDCQHYTIKDLEQINIGTRDNKPHMVYVIEGAYFDCTYIDQCVDSDGNLYIAVQGPKDAAYGMGPHGEFVVMPVRQ